VAVQAFFAEIRRELPELIIENCASGGHRLEPGMVGLTSMSSFSDAHECVEIPIIAANLQRLIPAHKSQIWQVLRPKDTLQRLAYGLAATLLGRMALSGDLAQMSPAQFALLQKGQALYERASPVIREGISWVEQRTLGPSYRYPTGWQHVRRLHPTRKQMLIVVHAFENAPKEPVEIALPPGNWRLTDSLQAVQVEPDADVLRLKFPADFSGDAYFLEGSEA